MNSYDGKETVCQQLIFALQHFFRQRPHQWGLHSPSPIVPYRWAMEKEDGIRQGRTGLWENLNDKRDSQEQQSQQNEEGVVNVPGVAAVFHAFSCGLKDARVCFMAFYDCKKDATDFLAHHRNRQTDRTGQPANRTVIHGRPFV
jgi:hypothetical protein